MDESKDIPTEQKILSAAEKVFHEKGFDGARMQEIADKATINKGLLHYYFKSKNALFEAIFSAALKKMVSNINSILSLDVSLEEKINHIVDAYMNMLLRNSALPVFVISELNKDPDKFIAKHLDEHLKNAFAKFNSTVQSEIKAGKIKPIDSKHLFINLISLIIFPFVGRPMIQVVVGLNKKEFHALMNERRGLIKAFIKEAIKK